MVAPLLEMRPRRLGMKAPIFRFSSTVRCGNSRRFSGTWAMPGPASMRRQAWRASLPPIAQLPARGRIRPEMTRSRVVLPAPFGPMTPTASPGSTRGRRRTAPGSRRSRRDDGERDGAGGHGGCLSARVSAAEIDLGDRGRPAPRPACPRRSSRRGRARPRGRRRASARP